MREVEKERRGEEEKDIWSGHGLVMQPVKARLDFICFCPLFRTLLRFPHSILLRGCSVLWLVGLGGHMKYHAANPARAATQAANRTWPVGFLSTAIAS